MSRLFAALMMFLCGCVSSPVLLAADVAEARSVFLIAAEGMADPRFRQSVVLVTRHGRSRSTIGVIVNRALDLSLAPLFPGLEAAAGHRLHYGGPVAPGQIVFLVRAATAPAAAINLGERLFISSDGASLGACSTRPLRTAACGYFAASPAGCQTSLKPKSIAATGTCCRSMRMRCSTIHSTTCGPSSGVAPPR